MATTETDIESDDWDEFDIQSDDVDEVDETLGSSDVREIKSRHRRNAARALEIRREQRWLDQELEDWYSEDFGPQDTHY